MAIFPESLFHYGLEINTHAHPHAANDWEINSVSGPLIHITEAEK